MMDGLAQLFWTLVFFAAVGTAVYFVLGRIDKGLQAKVRTGVSTLIGLALTGLAVAYDWIKIVIASIVGG